MLKDGARIIIYKIIYFLYYRPVQDVVQSAHVRAREREDSVIFPDFFKKKENPSTQDKRKAYEEGPTPIKNYFI